MAYKRISPQPVVEGGTGAQSFTAHSILLGQNTSPVTALGAATNGQLPIGSTGADPVLSTLTEGTGISIANGAGSITVSAAASVATTYDSDSGSATAALNVLNILGSGAIATSASGNTVTISSTPDVATTYDANSGSATAALNVLNLVGSGSITTSASGSTVTTSLTGLTQYNVLVGSGTSTITKVAPSATSGVPLISQGAAADPVFGTAAVAGGGTGATTLTGVLTGNGTSPVTASPVTQYTVLLGDASNAVTNVSGTGTSGQVLTSQGAGSPPQWATSSGGSGVWKLLDVQSATGSSVVFTGNFTSSYRFYVFFLEGVSQNTGTSQNIRLRVSNDGGSSFYSSGYDSLLASFVGAGGGTTSNTGVLVAKARSSSHISDGNVYCYGLAQSRVPTFTGQSICTSSSGINEVSNLGACHLTQTNIDAIEFSVTGANFSAGSILLYGITA